MNIPVDSDKIAGKSGQKCEIGHFVFPLCHGHDYISVLSPIFGCQPVVTSGTKF